LEELQLRSPVKLNAIYASQANIKKTLAVLLVWIAFQVGTKTSPNKLIVLIVQLEELQPRSPVKLNAIYVPQAAIKKTAARQSVWFALLVPMRPRVLIRVSHVLQGIGHQPKVLLQHRIVHLAFQENIWQQRVRLQRTPALSVLLERVVIFLQQHYQQCVSTA
jgi:hypothetical protein